MLNFFRPGEIRLFIVEDSNEIVFEWMGRKPRQRYAKCHLYRDASRDSQWTSTGHHVRPDPRGAAFPPSRLDYREARGPGSVGICTCDCHGTWIFHFLRSTQPVPIMYVALHAGDPGSSRYSKDVDEFKIAEQFATGCHCDCIYRKKTPKTAR